MKDFGFADSFMAIFGMHRAKCEGCKHAITSIAYPKMLCKYRDVFVDKDEQCEKWEKKQ